MPVATESTGIEWKVIDGDLRAVVVKDGKETLATWAPQPGSQEAFISCPVFEALYEGNRGGGKTDVFLMSFAQFCGKDLGPAWRGILFRQTYKQLGDVITKTKQWFKQIFGDSVSFNEQKTTWTWPGGEELLLRQMKDPADYWNYHGHSYPWIGFEELTTWPTDECYTRMMSVCRSSSSKVPRMFRATTNPYGVGHNWVKARFNLPLPPDAIVGPVIKTMEAGEELPDRVAVRSSLFENKVLLHADPKYITTLRASATNEAQLKAWIEGSWDIVAGGMFDDVWGGHCRVPDFKVPATWRLDRSFDWGSSKPFSVGWWAESDGSPLVFPGRTMHTVKGDLFRVREWYGWKGKPNEGLRMPAQEIAAIMREKELAFFDGRRVRPGPADSSIFDSSTATGTSVAKEMQAGKIRWTKADKSPGSRINGWQRMRTLMKNARPPKDGTPREHPGLFVTESCTQFLRTIPSLPRDDRKMDDVDTDAEDHIGDETRYKVYRSSGRFGKKKVTGR